MMIHLCFKVIHHALFCKARIVDIDPPANQQQGNQRADNGQKYEFPKQPCIVSLAILLDLLFIGTIIHCNLLFHFLTFQSEPASRPGVSWRRSPAVLLIKEQQYLCHETDFYQAGETPPCNLNPGAVLTLMRMRRQEL